MTISRRGLFGTLLGGIAAGYAAKVAPVYADGGLVSGKAGFFTANEILAGETILPLTTDGYVTGFSLVKSEPGVVEHIIRAPNLVIERMGKTAVRVTGDTVEIAGDLVHDGCTLDGVLDPPRGSSEPEA